MNSPFQWLPRSSELVVISLLFLATGVLTWALTRQGQRLSTAAAPHGILSLQMAWSAERAGQILASWQGDLKALANRQLALDYLYLLVYPWFLSLSCVMLARHVRAPLSDLGLLLAWTALSAGAFDAVENVFLLLLVNSGPTSIASVGATICSAAKFALVFSVIGYWAAAGVQLGLNVIWRGQ